MTDTAVPEVECEQAHAALRVTDVLAAVDFYTKKLGFRLGFTWGEPPTIAGVNLGNVQMFLEKGTPSPEGCAVYFVVGSADDLYELQRANGVEIIDEPGDRPMDYATTEFVISMDTNSASDTICSTPDPHWRLNASMFRCVSKSALPRCWEIWPNVSA
jgi:catechol 2,3-dioxygenase-like lactoylglutathione lyase family enzyme